MVPVERRTVELGDGERAVVPAAGGGRLEVVAVADRNRHPVVVVVAALATGGYSKITSNHANNLLRSSQKLQGRTLDMKTMATGDANVPWFVFLACYNMSD